MAMPRTGAAFNVNLSAEAHAGWQAWADRYGTTVTALVEIIGQEIHQGDAQMLRTAAVGRAARELSQARKRRRP